MITVKHLKILDQRLAIWQYCAKVGVLIPHGNNLLVAARVKLNTVGLSRSGISLYFRTFSYLVSGRFMGPHTFNTMTGAAPLPPE